MHRGGTTYIVYGTQAPGHPNKKEGTAVTAGRTDWDSRQRPVEWIVSRSPVPYEAACALMAERSAAVATGSAPELVWLLEHPPIYTAGTSAKPADLLSAGRFPVHTTGRGGQFTYHGPGQRVAYVMLDVKRRFGDVRVFVSALENWLIDSLAECGVNGCALKGRVGVWVPRPRGGDEQYDKIAAVGVRLRHWISSHGVSLNVAPDLEHFSGIVPCGVSDAGVTSLAALGHPLSMEAVDSFLRQAFEERIAATRDGSRHSMRDADAKTGHTRA
jgi:lipoyl(octanoyl) transferase